MGHEPAVKHNAKGRQSTAGHKSKRNRKHKPLASNANIGEQNDSNNLVHVAKTKEEKEVERRERLKQELLAQADSKWTSKKKKNLEKYIDKKLKKEERIVILEKLSQSQAQLPNTVLLQSSSTLGTGRAATHRELLDKQEDKEVRQALHGHAANGKRKRQEDVYALTGPDLDEDDEDDDEEHKVYHHDGGENVTVRQQDVESTPKATAGTVGSALQRNADGSIVPPKVRPKSQKTRSKKSKFSSWGRNTGAQQPAAEDGSDTSFDSSDSANDSSDGEDGEQEEWGGIQEDDGASGSGSGSGSGSEEDESEAEDDEETADEPTSHPKKKKLGFKDWAIQQLGISKGYDPTPTSADPPPIPTTEATTEAEQQPPPDAPPTKKRKLSPVPMRGPLGEDLHLPDTSLARHLLPSFSSALTPNSKPTLPSTSTSTSPPIRPSISRPPAIQESRLLLPITADEQPIMESILLNPVVVICGETGSGKTTQVPQFLYEAGFGFPASPNPGMIAITQPRRVAAISMAARLAHELSLEASGLPPTTVGYQIRYDATTSKGTAIKFMTDGVLLRELSRDFLLGRYSVVIIDEAHERTLNTDILIGVLSRVVRLREEMWREGKEGATPLRLIIMSATLRVADFSENTTLFPSPPPVLSVAARQHPVTVHFNRRTPADYVVEAVRKTSKIHTRLPEGGILIFMTGQNEIVSVCRKLEKRFGKGRKRRALQERQGRAGVGRKGEKGEEDEEEQEDTRTVGPAHADVEAEDIDLGQDATAPDDLAFDIDADMDEDPEALDSDDDDEEERRMEEELGLEGSDAPMHIVPLYSLLPSEKQMLVFEPPPPGSRLVVVSTNIAETSLTIPGIRYVVDCGRAKERQYDVTSGIQSFQVNWISKASASQRAGRAGRTGPGHCYRLYSSALFEHHFEAFSQPEILRTPIEGVVLQMKGMHIDTVTNFPFPTPPDRATLYQAEKVLNHLGALAEGQITELGRTMSLFPLSPRFSRMLVSGQQHRCLPYVIAIVSALSVGDPFLRDESLDGGEDEDELDKSAFAHLTSEAVRAKEAMRLRRKAFFASQHIHSSLGSSSSDIFKFLSVVGAYEYAGGGHQFCAEHHVRLKAMEEIHKLRAQISHIVHTNFPGVDPGFDPKLPPPSDLQLKVLRQLLTAGFIDQVAVRKDRIEQIAGGAQYSSSKGVAYRALGVPEDVFIHPSSVLANSPPPEYLVFNEVVRTSRVWIKGLTVVNPSWLSSLGKGSLCTFSKPTKNSAGIMMVIPRFGPDGWELPAIKAEKQ